MTKSLAEEQIERRIVAAMDSADRQLMAGAISQKDYDSFVADLDKWAEAQFANSRYGWKG